jgi:Zn-dependent metalloprotease
LPVRFAPFARFRAPAALTCAVVTLSMLTGPVTGQTRHRTSEPVDRAVLRQDAAVQALTRSGELHVRRIDRDTIVRGRVHTRLQQFHDGVPVLGAEITRQSDDSGATVSLFGGIYSGVDVDTTPYVTVEEATAMIASISGVAPGPLRPPRLLIAPIDGRFVLAYSATVFTRHGAVALLLDAHTGDLLQQTAGVQEQSAIGVGTGVLGDRKKVSVSASSGTYTADDLLRPPSLVTYDMHGDLQRTLDYLNGYTTLAASDRASDTDNAWSDGAAVDAHAYSGYFYDYYFKRFGRRGLDDNNFHMISLVHPVRRDAFRSQTSDVVGLFYTNAFYSGNGIMVYGEGLPGGITAGGQTWNYVAGALDVVAHELTHGVTDFTSQLIYENESGALNESFSDMMGTAVELFYQPPGSGPMQGDYLIAEDVVTPGGIRSMADPAAYGQPDHYSRRAILPLSRDNGGVHVNSGIPNQVFYLAIEGGTNRTSGLSVQGVGFANRDQIEKVMYRAFTQMMPANATFATARAVTIQAAADLYGAGSAAARAMTQAWTAVGVQ